MSTTPSPPRRARLSAAERRERIEDAATELFARRGYHATAMGEIARQAGVTVPVLYDHFRSKLDLHRRLLERHYADLRTIWLAAAGRGFSDRDSLTAAFDAWFAYVESHPFASRMLFIDTTGDPEIQSIHRQVATRSRELMLPVLAAQPGVARLAGGTDAQGLELAWEVVRSLLQGLAVWWAEHPEVPRARVVTTAVNVLWGALEGTSDPTP